MQLQCLSSIQKEIVLKLKNDLVYGLNHDSTAFTEYRNYLFSQKDRLIEIRGKRRYGTAYDDKKKIMTHIKRLGDIELIATHEYLIGRSNVRIELLIQILLYNEKKEGRLPSDSHVSGRFTKY